MKKISLFIFTLSMFCVSCSKSKNPFSFVTKANDPDFVSPSETSELKTVSTVDPDKTQKLSAPAVQGLEGAHVTISPGSLSISTDIVMEQGSDFSETTVGNEIGLATDLQVSGTSPGMIVRPTVETNLQKPLSVLMPLPLILNLQNSNARYVVFYKYYRQEDKQIVIGLQPVDGIKARIAIDATTGKEFIETEGYFGIYWTAILNRDLRTDEIPVSKVSEEPILSKKKIVVISNGGIVAETEIKSRLPGIGVVWDKVDIRFDSSTKVLKVSSAVDSGRILSACKVDLFSSLTQSSGLTFEATLGPKFEYTLASQEAQTFIGRFRCVDDQGQYTVSPWSEKLSIEAVTTPSVDSPVSPAEAKVLTLAWRAGSKTSEAPSVTSGPNATPSARRDSATWTDNQGRLWLFGGFGVLSSDPHTVANQDHANDLWMFDPSTRLWTLVKGNLTLGSAGVYSGSAANLIPAARYAASRWYADGRLYLFGGNGYTVHSGGTNGNLSDLWYFNIATSNWVLVSGDATFNSASVTTGLSARPSARRNAQVAVLSQKLWLFGGETASDRLNDVWVLDLTNNTWSQKIGIAAASNINPSGRAFAAHWGLGTKLYIHGGLRGASGALTSQETWQLETSSTNPAWTRLGSVKDSDATSAFAVGAPYIFSATNHPGPTRRSATWTDAKGRLWLSGGEGNNSSDLTQLGRVANLWIFDPSLSQWAYYGDGNDHSAFNLSPVYTTLNMFTPFGVAAGKNHLGSRSQHAAWYANGHAWIFGGEGLGEAPDMVPAVNNNMWEIDLP